MIPQYEDFVSFDDAKKLKELSFDWEVNHFYNDDGSFHQNFYINFNYHDTLDKINGELVKTERFSAPTINQANRWLFEKYNLFVTVVKIDDKYCYEILKNRYPIQNFAMYDTPFKALSEGVKYCINNLESIFKPIDLSNTKFTDRVDLF